MDSWACNSRRMIWFVVGGALLVGAGDAVAEVTSPLLTQTSEEVAAKSFGCLCCHENVTDMHRQETVMLGYVDCHGGNPEAVTIEQAHVFPRFPDAWRTSANPVRSYTLLNHESPEFIRFVNPGDLRVADISCGG